MTCDMLREEVLVRDDILCEDDRGRLCSDAERKPLDCLEDEIRCTLLSDTRLFLIPSLDELLTSNFRLLLPSFCEGDSCRLGLLGLFLQLSLEVLLGVYSCGVVLLVHNSPQTSSVGVLGDLSFLKMFLMDAFFIIFAVRVEEKRSMG